MFRKRDTNIHFVGIGGIGMSGIAEVLLNLGHHVSGSDIAESDTTRRLRGLGATIFLGHDGAQVGDADVVVISSAVSPTNPEVVTAREQRIPVIPRAEMLAELMRLKAAVLVAGSHGKTTTTSLIASDLHASGLDPTVVIGGKVNSFDSNARVGYGDFLVAEADESDGSFLCLTPTWAVITNIDDEHMDHYGSRKALLDAFVGFANRIPFYGAAVVCTDSPNVCEILPRLNKRTYTYGLTGEPDYLAVDLHHKGPTTSFRVLARGEDLGEFVVKMPGRHNVLNSLATLAVGDLLQVHRETSRQTLAQFEGVQRRFSVRGEHAGITVVDDYGHHPTEIRATLAGARASFPDHRIIAIIQPHRYTRLRDNFLGFADACANADMVLVTDVYAAGEAPIEGYCGQSLTKAIAHALGSAKSVQHVPTLEAIPDFLLAQLRPQDLVLTLGAGSITKLSHELARRIAQR